MAGEGEGSGSGSDRISFLPDDVILRLLSFLPTDAAVRTSTLSKRWIHLWKSVDVIQLPNLPDLESYGSLYRCLALNTAPKIRKFQVSANIRLETKRNFEGWIRFAIKFAIAKHVQTLELYMNIAFEGDRSCYWWDRSPDYIRIPESLYLQDPELRHEIALSCAFFAPPVQQLKLRAGGYEFLKRLSLFDCRIYLDDFESFMSTCRNLESLSIIRCYSPSLTNISGDALKEFVYAQNGDLPLGVIEIDAPNLVILNAVCCMGGFQFRTSCYPSEIRLLGYNDEFVSDLLIDDVYNVNDDVENYYTIKRRDNTLQWLDHCTQVQVFAINNFMFIPILTKALHYNGGPCNTFKCLREFFFARWKPQKDDLIVLLQFLGDCPCLEKVQLEFEYFFHDDGLPLMITPKTEMNHDEYSQTWLTWRKHEEIEEIDDDEVAKLSNVTFNRLKTIELYNYYGERAQRERVKYFLLKAVSLERLTLLYEVPKNQIFRSDLHGGVSLIVEPHHKQRLLTEVSLLPRASPSAQVCLG